MRHFVYLDTDILNSYLSQINGGLLNSTYNETIDEVATTKSDKTEPNKGSFKTEIGIKPLLNFTLTEDKDSINTTNTLSQIETGRELITKILHDNAFDLFISYLRKDKLIKSIEDSKLNDYVAIDSDFIIRDLKYISGLLSENFIDCMAEQTAISIIKQSENTNLNNNNIKKQEERKKENAKKEIKKQFGEYRKMFEIIDEMMPYSQFIICDNCLVPIRDKYLRETLKQIRFNYSGKIKIVGKYTSVLKNAVNKGSRENGTFGEFNCILDNAFKELYMNFLDFNDNMKIILPIALYFE